MATTLDFVEYVIEQINIPVTIRHRKMFGEYMVYLDELPILLICDNTVYVKKLPCIESLSDGLSCGCPYTGAREHYILDMEDDDKANEILMLLVQNTPPPPPKKKKSRQ